ncbi:MAG: branched-chain amino acid ABC transporter permease [Streptosporangiales bacterium]|nr:branched-chain amino acid ABC transporter permease [Streptosporangiales bacterium]
MTNALQTLILGLLLGGVYALMASGLTLVFGVMRIVNLAHAAFVTVGAYVAYGVFTAFRIDPLLSILVTMPALFVLGALLYRLLYAGIEGSHRFVEMTVLVGFALALITEGLLVTLFTGIYRSTRPWYSTASFELGPLFIPEGQLYASGVSVVLLALLWVFLHFTRTGYAIRATSQNRTSAQIVGVNVRRISTVAFGVGLALAGASGSLMSFLFTFFPSGHWQWIAILLSLIVLGGLGSLRGALVGAFGLAVIATFVSTWLGQTWSPLTFFLALFVILLVRPHGIFGKELEA